jgi:pyruvate kinase
MRTKIIATIGPSSLSYKELRKMKKAGMEIIRINTKYNNKKQSEEIIRIAEKIKTKVLIDLKNRRYLKWINSLKFHYLAVSFAENPGEIEKIRKLINKRIKIISKIESKKAIKNIDKLISVSDGIMIARGDLSKNISFEKVPYVQKIIMKKVPKGKIDITATEMLLSMMKSRSPSRADVSDIANAVLDGSDALMLSEETAIGRNPSLCIKVMNKIAKEAEKYKNLLN